MDLVPVFHVGKNGRMDGAIKAAKDQVFYLMYTLTEGTGRKHEPRSVLSLRGRKYPAAPPKQVRLPGPQRAPPPFQRALSNFVRPCNPACVISAT